MFTDNMSIHEVRAHLTGLNLGQQAAPLMRRVTESGSAQIDVPTGGTLTLTERSPGRYRLIIH